MIHAAARAAATSGRTVLGVATTSKAVAELEGAGVGAVTIAHLRLDLRTAPLPAGTVLVLDEVSQTSTLDAETVLAAIAACDGGQVWILGDSRQGRSVLAGGLAAELASRAKPTADSRKRRSPSTAVRSTPPTEPPSTSSATGSPPSPNRSGQTAGGSTTPAPPKRPARRWPQQSPTTSTGTAQHRSSP